MDRKVNLKDIAREAGVSVSLVSFVMNNRIGADGKPKYRVGEATRQRILDAAQRLHYQPVERILQRKLRSLVAGVILPDPHSFADFSVQLERQALQEGFTLLFGYSHGRPVHFARLLDVFRSRRVNGLIAVPPAADDPLEAGLPCVVPEGMEEDPFSCAADCIRRLLRQIEENENKPLQL